MNRKQSAAIPEKYRIRHYAGSTAARGNGGGGSAAEYHYIWQSFDGEVCIVVAPEEQQLGKTLVITFYINGNLSGSKTFTKTDSEGNFYEAIFSGLEYGDSFRFGIAYQEEEIIILNEITYIGSNGFAPDLTERDGYIYANMDSPYNRSYSMALGVLHFNSDYGTLRSSYDREARTRLYESCLQYTEYDNMLGKVGNFMSFWLDGYDADTDSFTEPARFTHEAIITKFPWDNIHVGIKSPKSTKYYSQFSNYVNDWINDINLLLGRTFAVRDDEITEDGYGIRITIGTHEELWGYDPDVIEEECTFYYGHWDCTRWYPSLAAIGHCEVKLCNEFRAAINNTSAFKDIVYEELTECLGCGNDTFGTYNSMFSEIWYIGKTNRLLDSGGNATIDGQVVQMLYNELDLGEKASSVIHKLTPSRSAVIQLPNNVLGIEGYGYTIDAYSMNRMVTWKDGDFYWDSGYNCFSDRDRDSLEILVKPVQGRPENWEWDPAIGADVYVPNNGLFYYPVTAEEWNEFTDRINAFRKYKSMSEYTFTTVKSGDEFTAEIYNQAVYAIQGIQGYGTGLAKITSSTELKANLFTNLESELNAIP